jgi:hypothetical protein
MQTRIKAIVGIISSIGIALLATGVASLIPNPHEPTTDLASFLYSLMSLPAPLAGVAIVMGIVLLFVAGIIARLCSIRV